MRYRLPCGEIINGEIVNIVSFAPDPNLFFSKHASRRVLEKVTRYCSMHHTLFWVRVVYHKTGTQYYTTYTWDKHFWDSRNLLMFRKRYEI